MSNPMLRKLVGHLNPEVLDHSPDRAVAFQMSHTSGRLTWRVAAEQLFLTSGGASAPQTILDLTGYTVARLAAAIGSMSGFVITAAPPAELSPLSALILLEQSGDISVSLGDKVFAYTSEIWALLHPAARVLTEASDAIDAAPLQISTVTAKGRFLDAIGGYYGVPRKPGELDEAYAPRIPAEVVRPAGNNVAIEMALITAFGQEADVTDVTLYGNPFPAYDGNIVHDGTYQHNASASVIYGAFDVAIGYSAASGYSRNDYTALVRALVMRLRDAGTLLRTITLRDA